MVQHLEIIDNEDGTFTLAKNLEFMSYSIPKGFQTDFASVPKSLHWFVEPYGKHSKAAVLHDYLYTTLGGKYNLTRKECDQTFYHALVKCGVLRWKAYVMYKAVRIAGWVPWNKYKNDYQF